MRSFRQAPTVLFLTGMLLAACWFGSVPAPTMNCTSNASTPDEDASRLVEDVLRKAGSNDGESLGDWSRSILDRALKRAGEERAADRPPDRGEPAPASEPEGQALERPDGPPIPSRPNAMRRGLGEAQPDVPALRKS